MDRENISMSVKKLSNTFRRRLFCDEDNPEKMTHSEGRIIHFLLKNMDRDIYQKDIQERFGIRASSASSQLKKLEKDGLVERVQVEGDARLKRIVPTKKLISQKDFIDERSRMLNERLVKGISDDDLETFTEVINRMIRNMEDEDR